MIYYADDHVQITHEEVHIRENIYPIEAIQWAAIATTDAKGQAVVRIRLWTSVIGLIVLAFTAAYVADTVFHVRETSWTTVFQIALWGIIYVLLGIVMRRFKVKKTYGVELKGKFGHLVVLQTDDAAYALKIVDTVRSVLRSRLENKRSKTPSILSS